MERPLLHDRQRRPRRRSRSTTRAASRSATRRCSLGFAFAQTNTGHDSRKEPGGTFVLSNPQKAIDYAYRAVHLTATTAKDITKDYYGKPVARSYWNSCSNGGRQGLHRGAALSRRLRRHRGQRAVGRSDRLHDRRDVEPESAQSRRRSPPAKLALVAEQGDGEVRCHRRPEGRPDRRSAQMRLRPGARRAGVPRRAPMARTA